MIKENIQEYAKQYLGKNVFIKIDRPLNSKHPKYKFVYKLNYGFIPKTKAPDGEEVDAYLIGVNKPVKQFEGKCIAVIHRLNDDDDKLIVVPKNFINITDREITEAVFFQEQWFKSEIIRFKKYE